MVKSDERKLNLIEIGQHRADGGANIIHKSLSLVAQKQWNHKLLLTISRKCPLELLSSQNLPIPISQRTPVSNGEHEHVKPFAVALHMPPFKHGRLEHASMTRMAEDDVSRKISMRHQ